MSRARPAFALLCGGVLAAAGACAQTLDIYSEFQRVDPFGAVVAADRGLARREILSPAVARNAFASFHVVVSVPAKESYFLFVGTNPPNACSFTLYREHFVKTEQGWIPDTLVETPRIPDFGVMPDPDENIDGQTTRLYLLDLWIPPDTPLHGFRLEVQMKVGIWVIRPLEVRVMAARVPDLTGVPSGPEKSIPPIDRGADAAAIDPLTAYVSGAAMATNAPPLTLRGTIRRNAIQDMLLAGSLPAAVAGPQAMGKRVVDLFGSNYQSYARISGAEWYLRLRDFLAGQASRPVPR
ncbi:MAG: hypothetical protein LAP87_09520 [Acidobacteriia bacterium]|nr:hypothetical protein [Terriglobia bacterium]